jgi:hypothetical protein
MFFPPQLIRVNSIVWGIYRIKMAEATRLELPTFGMTDRPKAYFTIIYRPLEPSKTV